MELVHTPEEFRTACNRVRAERRTVGLVPTMGALHRGHASLMECAVRDGCATCVSIFVNPTQFGPNEDFSRYPRTLESDLDLCRAAGALVVFAPETGGMYFDDDSTRVQVRGLTEGLCGASRPGHFDGVTTIVAKLFALAGPCRAYFGKKDYQQLRVIQRMTRDLMLDINVVGCPIVREPDGLALSSRNRYLSPEERVQALGIVNGLERADLAYRAGEREGEKLIALVTESVVSSSLRVDYVELRAATGLKKLDRASDSAGESVLAVAAFCGKTRLIDNMELGGARASVLPRSKWAPT